MYMYVPMAFHFCDFWCVTFCPDQSRDLGNPRDRSCQCVSSVMDVNRGCAYRRNIIRIIKW